MSLNFIAPGDVSAYRKQGRALIIDIRDRSAYRRGHIPGAINMPYDMFDVDSPRLKTHSLIILCCDKGSASLVLGRRLSRMGYNVLSVGGGMEGYKGALER